MNTTQFFEQLEASIARYDLLCHPFYRAWAAGELTRDDLREYARHYYHHVEAFPSTCRSRKSGNWYGTSTAWRVKARRKKRWPRFTSTNLKFHAWPRRKNAACARCMAPTTKLADISRSMPPPTSSTRMSGASNWRIASRPIRKRRNPRWNRSGAEGVRGLIRVCHT